MITTERARPASPRSSCRNSCTSRPRSPISPITETSASTLRASIDSSTDLPTPEPEKMPMRWRRQQVPVRHGRSALYQRPLAVDRLAHRVDDAAEPGGRWPHLPRRIGNDRTAAAPHAFKPCERHHHRIVAGEADHLGRDKPVPTGLDHDACAHRHGVDRPCNLHHQAAHAHDTAIDVDAVEVADLFGQCLHCETLKFPRLCLVRLTSCLPASLIITSLSLVTERARPPEGRVSRKSPLSRTLNVELERGG